MNYRFIVIKKHLSNLIYFFICVESDVVTYTACRWRYRRLQHDKKRVK